MCILFVFSLHAGRSESKICPLLLIHNRSSSVSPQKKSPENVREGQPHPSVIAASKSVLIVIGENDTKKCGTRPRLYLCSDHRCPEVEMSENDHEAPRCEKV